MAKWHYSHDGQKHGPVEPKELKRLVTEGVIGPDDLVWKEGMKDWAKASSVKGLVETTASTPTTLETAVNSAAKSDKGPGAWHWTPTVIASTMFCFPVGLALVWTHPGWGTMKKGIWTAFVGAFCLLFLIVNRQEKHAITRTIVTAHSDWGQGRRAAAVEKYRSLMDDKLSWIKPDDKRVIIGRLIEHHLAEGNNNEALSLVEFASATKIVPELPDDVRQKVAEVQKNENIAKAQRHEMFRRQYDKTYQPKYYDTPTEGAKAFQKAMERSERQRRDGY